MQLTFQIEHQRILRRQLPMSFKMVVHVLGSLTGELICVRISFNSLIVWKHMANSRRQFIKVMLIRNWSPFEIDQKG